VWAPADEIVSDVTSGEWLDAKVDGADEVQVAFTYASRGATELDYLYRDASGRWSPTYVVDDYSISGSSYVGYYVSLAIDTIGLPSFAYYDDDNGVPVLTDFTSLGFGVSSQIDINYAGATGYYTSLALDSDDYDYVAWYDDGIFAQEVQFSVPADGVFSEVIDGDAGNEISLAMRSDDVPCVAYQSTDTANLLYGCRNADESWTLETVDSVGAVGVDAALVFDAADTPWIAYYDETRGDLQVATAKAGAWTLIDVDTVGDVGRAPSIAVDSGGAVHISYYDVTNGTLKYAVGR